MLFFFFNDTATTEIYTLSLHDALPIWPGRAPYRGSSAAGCSARPGTGRRVGGQRPRRRRWWWLCRVGSRQGSGRGDLPARSEEHTSELQSRQYLVCRLLLEKNKFRKVA